MDQGRRKIKGVRGAAIACFIVCFLVFVSICVWQTQYRGEVSPARTFWGTMTIIAAISIAQVEVMLAVLYPEDFRKSLFRKDSSKAIKGKK